MPYYFKNSSIDNNFHSINLKKVANSGFNYKNDSDATSAEYEASVTAIGEYFSTTYKPKHTISNNYFYAIVPTNNAITRVVFTIDSYPSNTWCIYALRFRNVFSGKIHFKIQSVSMGAGTSGAYSTVLDDYGIVDAENDKTVYMTSGHIQGHALSFGSMTSARYVITITATATSGEVITLNLPCVYCVDNSDSTFNFYISSPITATGYDSINLTSTPLESEDSYQNSGYTTPITLNLEAMTFKYADYDY